MTSENANQSQSQVLVSSQMAAKSDNGSQQSLANSMVSISTKGLPKLPNERSANF